MLATRASKQEYAVSETLTARIGRGFPVHHYDDALNVNNHRIHTIAYLLIGVPRAAWNQAAFLQSFGKTMLQWQALEGFQISGFRHGIQRLSVLGLHFGNSILTSPSRRMPDENADDS